MSKDKKTVQKQEIDPGIAPYRDHYLKSAFDYAMNQPQSFYGIPGYQQQNPFAGQVPGPRQQGSNGRPNSRDEALAMHGPRGAKAWDKGLFGQPGGGGGITFQGQPTGGPGGPGGNFGFTPPPMFGAGEDPWVAAGGKAGDYYDQFRNPYESEVIGGVQRDFDRQRNQLGMRVNDLATKARAFGGSRHAVLEGAGRRDIGQNESDALAGLRYSGFSTNMDRALGERGYQRTIRQAEMDAGRYRFDQAQNFGLSRLGIMGGALSGAPQGSQTTNIEKGNLFNDLLGAGLTAGSFFMGKP